MHAMNMKIEQNLAFDDYLAATLAISGLGLPTAVVARTTEIIVRQGIGGNEGFIPLSLLSLYIGVKAVEHAMRLPLREN